jgi:hypothetical protein
MKKTAIVTAALVCLWCAVWSNVGSAVVVKAQKGDTMQDWCSDDFDRGLRLFDRNDSANINRAIEAIKAINKRVGQWVANNEVVGQHVGEITPVTNNMIVENYYYYLPPANLVRRVVNGELAEDDLLELVKSDFNTALNAPLPMERSLNGTWSWSAKCRRTKDGVIIPFSGSFSVYNQSDKDGKWGTFGSSHPGDIFNATITPKKLAFDRVFDGNTRRQRWDGSWDGKVLKGTVTDSAHTKMGLSQTCDFTAEQIYKDLAESIDGGFSVSTDYEEDEIENFDKIENSDVKRTDSTPWISRFFESLGDLLFGWL